MERTNTLEAPQQILGTKPKPEARPGNIALDVGRPLFESGPNWDFHSYKTHMLGTQTVDQLAELHFFDGEDQTDDLDTVVMTSYPRSGNTLLRAYLEKIMGLVTGSDCDITKKLNLALMDLGLAGEGLVDKRVWIVKTHYPERYGKTRFGAERAILLIRSPLDCITSLFNMVCSGSHDLSIADQDFLAFNKYWNEFIEQEITVWKDFHDFWLKAKIPVHLIRYEDILQRPVESMTDLMKFIFNVESIQDSLLSQYIELASVERAPEIYKPRKGKVHGNSEKFNQMQLDFMASYAQELLKNFGYFDLFN